MRTSARISLNTISRWLGLGVSTFVGIVIVPIMLDQFGKDGYGLIGICGALLALRSIMDFGLRAAITRELAVAGASEGGAYYNRLVSSALAAYLILGGLSAVACLTLAPLLVDSLNVSAGLKSEGLFLIRWYAGPLFLLIFATAPMACVLTSSNRFDLLNYAEAGTQIIRSVGVLLVLLLSPWGLYGYACVEVTAYAIHLVMVSVIAHHARPSLKIRLHKARLRTLPVKTSSRIFLLTLSEQISMTSDNFVLSALIGPAAVGLYVPGRLLSRRLRPVIDAVKDQLHPLATARYTTGHMSQLREILFQGTKYRLLMGIGTCVGIALYAPHLAQVWLSSKLSQEELHTVAMVMILWAITDLWTYAGGSQWPVLFGMKKFRFLVRLSFPLAILNLIGSILMVAFTDVGLLGVVIPTLVMETIRVLITYRYCCRCLQVSALEYFRQSYLRPLLVLIALGIFSEAIRRLLVPCDITALLASAIICGLAWAGLCWFIGLQPADRKRIFDLVHAAVRKLPFIQGRQPACASDQVSK